RRADHNDVRQLDDLEVGAGRRNDVAIQRFAYDERVGVAPHEHDIGPRLLQRQGKRRAHQAQPDDGDGGHYRYASCFCIAPSRRLTSSMRRSKVAKSSDCAPSDRAWFGVGWTSMMRPLAPAATAASDIGPTNDHLPVAWDGST